METFLIWGTCPLLTDLLRQQVRLCRASGLLPFLTTSDRMNRRRMSTPGISRVKGGLVSVHWRRATPFLVSGGCIGLLLLLFWGRVPDVISAIGMATPEMLAVAGGCYLLSIWVMSARLYVMFRAVGIRDAFFRFFLLTLIGLFFGSFLPTTVGGDVMKASYAAGRTNRLGDAIVATLGDRAVGFISVLLVGSIAVAFHPTLLPSAPVQWLPVAALLGLIVLMTVFHSERFVQWTLCSLEQLPIICRPELMQLARATLGVLRAPMLLSLGLALGLVSVMLSSLTLLAAARSLGIDSDLIVLLLLLPVMVLASLLPSINGVGVREVTFVFVLRGTMPEEKALALSLLFYGLGMACAAIGGLVFLLRRPLGLELSRTISSKMLGGD